MTKAELIKKLQEEIPEDGQIVFSQPGWLYSGFKLYYWPCKTSPVLTVIMTGGDKAWADYDSCVRDLFK